MTDSFRPGTLLGGRYRLDDELGRGGMATVYGATDTKHDRPVAVKVLDRARLAASDVVRFENEVAITARLSHPHIVPLLDSGEHGGNPFYVMPLIPGGTLRERLGGGALPVPEALRLAREIADALAYAHAQGAVHRDVKPENIMVNGRSAVVTDFGIARTHSVDAKGVDDVRVTLPSVVMGTPAYMSPEQAVGEPLIDGRSDAYSLGAVLYEMVTGERPFGQGTPAVVIARRFTDPAPSPRAKRPELSLAVDGLIRRAMARDVAARFASAAEFSDAIARVARESDESVETIPVPIGYVAPSLAVLPFEAIGGHPDDAFFADGLAEEILTALSRSGRIRVAARTSVLNAEIARADIRTLCARLGVRAVVTGSVRRTGDRVRISAQLVNGSDGFQLWAGKVDRALGDVFSLQDEVAARIAGELLGTLTTPTTLTPIGAATAVPAFERYMHARHLMGRRNSGSMTSASSLLEGAVRDDPTFAPAHASLAEIAVLRAVYGDVPPATAIQEAMQSIEAARRLDPSNLIARRALGVVKAAFEWNWTSAETELRAASVGSADAAPHQWLATMVHLPNRRHDEALGAASAALRIEPLSSAAHATHTCALLYSGRASEAAHAAQDLVARDPGFGVGHFFLAQALNVLGEHAAAVTAADAARKLSGSSAETVAFQAFALAAAGRHDEAVRVRDELVGMSSGRFVAGSHLAVAALGVGDHDGALAALEHAAEQRAVDLIWLGVRPVWRPLYEAPSLHRLIARMGLRVA